MKSEFRQKFAEHSSENTIHKVTQLIKAEGLSNDENAAFNGAELSECVLGHDWNSPEEDAAWSNL